MKILTTKNSFLYLFLLLAISLMYTPAMLHAQSADDQPKKQVKYRKAEYQLKLQRKCKVYESLERVDEKGEPDPDMETVVEILTDLRNQKDTLKSYDRSVMWNRGLYIIQMKNT